MVMKSFKPISDSLYEDSRRLNIKHFAKNFAGRVTFITLYSMNRTTTQSEFGQMNHSSARRYTKVENYPLWNVSRHELEVSYDFENSGLSSSEVVSSGVIIDRIYNVVVGDLFEFNNYDGEAKLYEVSDVEDNFAMVEDYNFTKINYKLVDKNKKTILANVNQELYYDFEKSLMFDNSMVNKFKLMPQVLELSKLEDKYNTIIAEHYDITVGPDRELNDYLFNLVENKYEFFENNNLIMKDKFSLFDFEKDDISYISSEFSNFTFDLYNIYGLLQEMRRLHMLKIIAEVDDYYMLKVRFEYEF